MKYFVFFLLITTSALAQKLSEGEVLERVNKLDEALKDSPLYKECEEKIESVDLTQASKDKLAECFEQNLKDVDDKQMKELGKALELSTFGVDDKVNAGGIREFLTHRLRKGLYGDSYDEKKGEIKKGKKKKLVGHDTYFELYKAQLSKSILLEVNRYCLENLRDKSADSVSIDGETIYLTSPRVKTGATIITSNDIKNLDDKSGTQIASLINRFDLTEQSFNYTRLDEVAPPVTNALKLLNSKRALEQSVTLGEFANTYNTEQDVILNKTKIPDGKGNKVDPLSIKQNMCIAAMNLMCACYENREGSSKCEVNGKNLGKIACNIKSKIRDHRKRFEVVEKSEKVLDSTKYLSKKNKIRTGFNSDNLEIYTGKGKGEKTIDQLTNITSTEIGQIEDLNKENIEDKLALLSDCEKNVDANENCEAIMSEETASLRKAEIARQEAVKQKKLLEIKGFDDETLKEFLKDNGHKDLLVKLENKDLKEQEIKEILKKKLTAEKDSIIDQMNAKLAQAMKKPTKASRGAASSVDPAKVIKEEKTKIEIKRDRFADVLHYSNVVSSYLSLKKKDGDDIRDVGKNTMALKQEYDQFQDSDSSTAEDKKYWKNLQADADSYEPSSKTDNDSASIDLNMIDRILGNTSDDSKKSK